MMESHAGAEMLAALAVRIDALTLPDPWFTAALSAALADTAILWRNGAEEAARARARLTEDLIGAAEQWLDGEVDVPEGARLRNCSEETFRRKVRSGVIPDQRDRPRGRIRARRADVLRAGQAARTPYDVVGDAQDIALLRRLK